MALYLQNAQGTVYLNGQVVAPAECPVDVTWPDCVSTGADGSVTICCDGAVAARVSGPNSRVQPYIPPTQTLYLLYYRYSYRWQMRTPGGSVGVRA